MKLLFDENLSWRLSEQLSALYPDSQHVRDAGLKESGDAEIWEYAKANDLVIVTKDIDFQQRALLLGHPPKVVRLRVGNCRVETIEKLMRAHSDDIHAFAVSQVKSYLSLP